MRATPPATGRASRRLDWPALAVPGFLLALLVAFLVADPGLLGLHGGPEDRPGGPGLGDPYFPRAGNAGYDVLSYRVDGSWDPGGTTLVATTTIVARAGADLPSFYVDLYLDVRSVTVDGRPATAKRHDDLDVLITPSSTIRSGARFTVVIGYAGGPDSAPRRDMAGWFGAGQEWIVSGEPGSSPWWYPSNDHPSDPATFEVTMRVPAGLEAVSVGRLISRDTGDEADFDTWHWRLDAPAATYLTFLAVGQYVLDVGRVDGRQAVYAVSEQLPAAARTRAMQQLQTSGAVVRGLEREFGPYPFDQIGGVVPAADVPFAGLETQTRPVYASSAMTRDGSAVDLLTHELAHSWFGDNVTVAEWNDIFDNEAYASFAAWLATERRGGPTAQQQFDETFAAYRDRTGFWQVPMSDPGRDNLFTVVYLRGPMTLQALRNVMGDDAFLTASRAWAQDRGTRSLEQWRTAMQAATDQDLTGFFAAWLDGTTVPEQTAANGFG